MLDYKNIIINRYALNMSYKELADKFKASKSGINDFLRAFEKCDKLSYPLPEGITNYAIAEIVYGHIPGSSTKSSFYEQPDYESVFRQMSDRKNMTLVYQWNRYRRECESKGSKPYQYRQFCERYSRWCDENYETLHIQAVIGQKMEVDFAGKVFSLIDPVTEEKTPVVVFVAVLPYSQYAYAEGMVSTREPQWIDVNNNALRYFGGVPLIVVCDNCKQAVTANKDWIDPDLNKDYAEWAEHNHTVILPAKVRKPRYKSSVENTVGILEKGLFHDLEDNRYFTIEEFNRDLHSKIEALNHRPLTKKDMSRYDLWQEERKELKPLPSMPYTYMERKTAKVSGDFHVRFDNAYYSVDKAFLHKNVMIGATSDRVNIYSMQGELIVSWHRAKRRGEWLTDPKHLPDHYKQVSGWSSSYFIRKAMTIGPNTVKVIEQVLKSREHEVQTYRLCTGILNFAKKYSRLTLEDCCAQAIETGHVSYSFIKNSISSVAEDKGTEGYNSKLNEERNKGAFVMGPHAGDIELLLLKSRKLAGKEVSHDD